MVESESVPSPTLRLEQVKSPQAHKVSEKNPVACGDDSDCCDFDLMDHEIQDTLLKRSISSEEDQVVPTS